MWKKSSVFPYSDHLDPTTDDVSPYLKVGRRHPAASSSAPHASALYKSKGLEGTERTGQRQALQVIGCYIDMKVLFTMHF